MREGSPPPAAAAPKQQGSGRSRSSSSRLHHMLSSQQQQQQQQQQRRSKQQEQSLQQHQQQQQLQQQQLQQQRQRKPPEPLRRAVADCLSASHHPPSFQPLRTLQDYLANSSTIHFAYTVLLEHAIAERDRSPAVVIKCVSLLKRYLFRYVPSIATLQQIDSFCAALIRESEAASEKKSSNPGRGVCIDQSSVPLLPTSTVFASESLVKSLVYVRAVVARHLPGVSLHQQSFKLQPLQLSPLRFPASSNDKDPSTPPTALLLGLAAVEDGSSSDFIPLDLLKWRWIARKGTQVWTPSPVMLDSGGIARPQVEGLKNLEQGLAAFWLANSKQGEAQFVRASTATAMADAAATKSHLRDVAASKRHPTSRWGGEPVATIRKRQRPLFQYRYYSKQQPLRLSDADIEEVIAAVCAEATAPPPLPPVSHNGETANVAGSVLIKLVIDMYLADARTAAPLTLSILQVMLSAGPVVVRVRAFDLALNLGIHAHLLEPMQSDDPEASQAVFSEGNVYGTPQAVGEFESWLFTIVCEMLLFLVQLEEKGEAVWAAAMSTLLYLVCDRGHIRRQRLERVDIRVLRRLLDVSRENAWAEEIHCRLIRMTCNLLFISPGDATLDGDKLEAVGGMEFICREYALSHSSESKRNLFAVILECAICQLRGSWEKANRIEDEVQAIATALVLAGAPESLSVALKHKLSGVGGRISKSIIKALDRDIANGRLNVTLLEELTRSVDMLVDKHGSLDEELRDLISLSVEEELDDVSYLGSRGWTILHALLHSPRCDYRRHGQLWLKHLLEAEAECLHGRHKEEASHRHCIYKLVEQARPDGSECTTTASQLLFGLLRSRKHYVRQEFFIVFEHLLSQCQRMGCTNEEHGNMLVWLMSGSLWHFISANDTNRVNVLQMCNLMLSQILCLRWVRREGENTEGVAVSSPAALFIREEAAAPHKFVCAMPTALFYWPLMQLAGASMDDVSLGIAVGSKGGGNVPGCASDVRAALLLLLVAKCTLQQAALEEVGGQEFFRSLLDDPDARIAYYTASFLIKRMMLEDAESYQRVLHNLVFKAQQKNDEKLLENPYLQIGGILQQDPDPKAPVLIQDDS